MMAAAVRAAFAAAGESGLRAIGYGVMSAAEHAASSYRPGIVLLDLGTLAYPLVRFTEGGTAGAPAIALVATKSKRVSVAGIGGGHNKIDVPAGYVRKVVRISGTRDGRCAVRELLSVFGAGAQLPKGWRVAFGVIAD